MVIPAGQDHVDLSLQSQTDLRWIRSPFLDDERDHGVVVVHGHTISPGVEKLRAEDGRAGLLALGNFLERVTAFAVLDVDGGAALGLFL